MWVREKEIRFYLISTKQVKRIFDFCQSPYHLTIFQRSSCMHLHITSKYILTEEFESLLVLDWIPVFTYIGKNLTVSRTNESFLASRNTFAVEVDERFTFLNCPINASFFHHLDWCQII